MLMAELLACASAGLTRAQWWTPLAIYVAAVAWAEVNNSSLVRIPGEGGALFMGVFMFYWTGRGLRFLWDRSRATRA